MVFLSNSINASKLIEAIFLFKNIIVGQSLKKRVN